MGNPAIIGHELPWGSQCRKSQHRTRYSLLSTCVVSHGGDLHSFWVFSSNYLVRILL